MGRGSSKIGGGGAGGGQNPVPRPYGTLTSQDVEDYAKQIANDTVTSGVPPVMKTATGLVLSDSDRQKVLTKACDLIEDELANKYETKSVPIYDKWGDQFDTHVGFANGTRLITVEESGGVASVRMGDTTRGFVAANNGLEPLEAWKRARNYLANAGG